MIQSLELELTAADIVALTDLIYEEAPHFWRDGEWFYPQTYEREPLLVSCPGDFDICAPAPIASLMAQNRDRGHSEPGA